MVSCKVFSCERNDFDNGNVMFRITALSEDLGAIVLWSSKSYSRGQEIKLTIGVGQNLKPIVKIA